MKNHAADSKIGSPLKIDFRADWTHESNPTARELKSWFLSVYLLVICIQRKFSQIPHSKFNNKPKFSRIN